MTVPAAVEIAPGVAPGDGRLTLIAGPCLLESRELALSVATRLRDICAELGVPLVFKGSFDKANRTSAASFRGDRHGRGARDPRRGARDARAAGHSPTSTRPRRWRRVAEVVDVLQIPAFLCRQTDLLVAAGASGKVVNVKKGQFLAPGDMRYAVDKVRAGGGERVLLTERGTTFGYHDLVVDYRGLVAMRAFAPVIFDATHSVQSPGGAGGSSGGRRDLIAPLARAAVACGVDALFIETHPDPDSAPSDGPSMLPLDELEALLRRCLALHAATTP